MIAQTASPMVPMVVWGAGGHARVVADIIRLQSQFSIVGFLDDTPGSQPGRAFCGATVLGGSEQLSALLRDGVACATVAIGDNQVRSRLISELCRAGFRLPALIHPGAVVARDVWVGSASVIVAGAVVNPAARIGNGVIVNTCASVDHDCVVLNGAHISPGAHLAGGVTVCDRAWIGAGAVVVNRVTVGADSIVGAGSVVVRDIPSGVVAYGTPARVIRTR